MGRSSRSGTIEVPWWVETPRRTHLVWGEGLPPLDSRLKEWSSEVGAEDECAVSTIVRLVCGCSQERVEEEEGVQPTTTIHPPTNQPTLGPAAGARAGSLVGLLVGGWLLLVGLLLLPVSCQSPPPPPPPSRYAQYAQYVIRSIRNTLDTFDTRMRPSFFRGGNNICYCLPNPPTHPPQQ